MRKSRTPRELQPVELEFSAPIQGQGIGGEMAEHFAVGLGVELGQVAEDSGHQARARVLRWMDTTIRTRPSKRNPSGLPRRERVQRCGTVWAAQCGEHLGVAHKWCRDRMCPTCMERRQRQEARRLRRWFEARRDAGGLVLFPTLTQVKLPIEHETAAQAFARLMATRRELMNTRSRAGQELRRFVKGGIWCVELAWSYRGKLNPDGSRVAFSGWHPHLHGLIEVADPPPELRAKLGEARAREAWGRMASAALRRAWIRLNPEASWDAQRVEPVDLDRVGQVTKYALKPFEIVTASRSREAAVTLAKRRTHDAWGEWRGWIKKADALLDADREERGELERPPIRFGDVTVQGLAVRLDWGSRVYFHPPGGEDREGVPAADVVAAVKLDPRTFQRRVADEEAAAILAAQDPGARAPPGSAFSAAA